MDRLGGTILASPHSMLKTIFFLTVILFSLSSALFAQTFIHDEYWGGDSGRIQKDSLGPASEISGMEVVADDEKITVTITGPFFYNYVHHVKGAHKTPPGDLYISSAGWKVKGAPPYAQDTFTKDEGWDYVVSLFDKAVYKLDWSKIEWTRPKPGSVIYRRDQAWRGGYGGFVSWADIRLTDKSLVISFPLSALLQEIIPSSDDVPSGGVSPDTTSGTTVQGLGSDVGASAENGFDSANMLDIGLHWTMMCGNDVIEGAFVLPAEIYSDYEEAEEIPLPRPTTWTATPTTPVVPWQRTVAGGTVLLYGWDSGDDHGGGDNYKSVPEPSLALLLMTGIAALPFLAGRRRRQ